MDSYYKGWKYIFIFPCISFFIFRLASFDKCYILKLLLLVVTKTVILRLFGIRVVTVVVFLCDFICMRIIGAGVCTRVYAFSLASLAEPDTSSFSRFETMPTQHFLRPSQLPKSPSQAFCSQHRAIHSWAEPIQSLPIYFRIPSSLTSPYSFACSRFPVTCEFKARTQTKETQSFESSIA